MYTKSYRSALEFLSDLAPDIETKPGEFIRWAEGRAELLAFIYSVDYDTVTEDLTDQCKEAQDYRDDE